MSIKARAKLLIMLVVAGLCVTALAQDEEGEPVVWSLSADVKRPVAAGGTFRAALTAALAPGWHVFSITQGAGGPVATVISLPKGQPFSLGAAIQAPTPKKAFDPNFNIQTEFYEESVEFGLPVAVDKGVVKGKKSLRVSVYFQACNETMCQPPKTEILTADVMVTSGAVAGLQTAASDSATVGSLPGPGPTRASSTADSGSQPQPTLAAKETLELNPLAPLPDSERFNGSTFAAFLWLAAVMGALSLLTPCVFPMVPITVSYFTNHAGGNRRNAVFTAFVYTSGIILTFTALGMLLAAVFGAGGVNQLAANPWMNLLITGIFLGFAFALFGTYFLQVPSGLVNRLDSLTRNREGSQVVGALLMGFTFTLTSFTCTAPFVGTLLVMTANGNWHWPLAGMLVFSAVFAVPFFGLALAPQLLSQLPRAGGWMNSIKVVMGFLEIAAAMKFLSNADLVWHWGVFTRQVVLATWVAVGVLTVLYILGYFRMPHDSPVEAVGGARVTFAIVFLALTIWLIPGLFGRQLGELESFLPPELNAATTAASSTSGLSTTPHSDAGWIMNDYEGALAVARQQGKRVFIDFTGYTCTNCRWMETNMFTRADVRRELDQFVKVRLYTDGDGPVFEKQQQMQQARFGTVALPLYAVVDQDGKTIDVFPGLTRKAAEFIAFLQKGQAASPKV